MRPVKSKELIPIVAKDFNLSPEIVQDIISYYWREVRKNISGLSHPRIHITNLGDFFVKHWKIDDKIQKLERFEKNNELKGLQQLTARFKTAEDLYDLKRVRKSIMEEQDRKNFIKVHKITLKASEYKKSNSTVEEQRPDSGGNS